jgi:hypothetical protein
MILRPQLRNLGLSINGAKLSSGVDYTPDILYEFSFPSTKLPDELRQSNKYPFSDG